MTEQEFAKPGAPGANIDYDALEGGLLLIDVIALEPHIPTVHTKPGEKSPAIRADVHVLDGRLAGDEMIDSLLFPKMLQSQLRRSVGQRVLGRLHKGQAQPGKNAPWLLADATQGDYEAAQRWVASRSRVTSAPPPSAQDETPPF